MQIRGHRLKFIMVTGMVVLALTGFSTGRGRGGGGDGGGGGGCSSSAQDHDDSSSTSGGSSGSGSSGTWSGDDSYDDDDDYGYGATTGGGTNTSGTSGGSTSSGGGNSAQLKDGTAKLLSCATVKDPYATIKVTNPNSVRSTFDVHITFEDVDDATVSGTIEEVTVPAKESRTIRVEVANAEESVAEVDHCSLDPVASVNL